MSASTGLTLTELALEAQKKFDAAPPEIQYYTTLARRIHMRHTIMSRHDSKATLEDAARRHLTREVSEKYADLLLSKNSFRRVVGIPEIKT